MENNLIVSELKYGLENHCSRERTHHAADKAENETRPLGKTTTTGGKLKRPKVKLASLFYERVFREKTGPEILTPVISRRRMLIQNMLVVKQDLKLNKTLMKI